MNRVLSLLLIASSIATFAEAKGDYIEKIVHMYNVIYGGSLEFNQTKTKDGYSLDIKPKDIFSNNRVDILVDNGPLITKPSLSFAKAGFVADGNISSILNKRIANFIQKDIKEPIKYKYEGKLSFTGELDETITISPAHRDSSSNRLNISKIIATSSFDIDNFLGKQSIKIDNFSYLNKFGTIDLNISGINTTITVDQEPIDDIMLFSKYSINIDSLKYKSDTQKTMVNYSSKIESAIVRVDRELLDFKNNYKIKALDEPSIALAKGIKESNIKLDFKNLGIDGMLELLKMQKELNQYNEQMHNAKDDVAMQKAILKIQDYTNKIVPLWNKTVIANKSRLVVDLELKSIKKSTLKLDLIYKGKPLTGDAQNAVISLMAQQLNLFDGDIEIEIDSSLASTINPFAIIALEMFKNKGLAKVDNGVYRLKAKLKNGKIVINGKAYTIAELAKAIF